MKVISIIILVISLLTSSSAKLQADTNVQTNHLSKADLKYVATVLSNYPIVTNQLRLERNKNAEQSNIIVIQSNVILYYSKHFDNSSSFFATILEIVPVITLIILLIR